MAEKQRGMKAEYNDVSANMEGFAYAIENLFSDSGHFANECETFGMCWGCLPECPVWIRGECELQEENNEEFKKLGLI